jgi:phage protein D
MANLYYAPDFRVEINDQPVPAALRASISSVQYQTGLKEGVDRVELSVVNENLRWQDHDLLALDNPLTLFMGYAPDSLQKMFVGEIVSQSPTFPSGGVPMLTIAAQDRRQHLQEGNQTRWFAVPVPKYGNTPIPDTLVASMVATVNRLIPIFDPISAALSVLLGGVEVAVAMKQDPKMLQALIRKQVGESNLDFLKRIAHENGWEVLMDYSGPLGGYQLRFLSLAEHLSPEITLKYGQSLIDFTPRITKVGQIASVSVNIWISSIKTEFAVSASFDWESKSLNVNISPGFGMPGSMGATPQALGADKENPNAAKAQAEAQKTIDTTAVDKPDFTLAGKPVNAKSAPRMLLSNLLAVLNQRLTGSGSTIGDPRIQAGTVLRLDGLGQQFGGLYRVTSATHTIDSSGYRTSFEVRKEIWFESIPAFDQGAFKMLIPQHQFS